MRIKNLSNLYVLEVMEPMSILENQTFQLEESMIRPNCICQKEYTKEPESLYRDLERNKIYSLKDILETDRKDNTAIVPLSDYYNFLGIRKRNNYLNQEIVHKKVKTLKKQRKI